MAVKKVVGMRRIKLIRLEDETFFDELSEEGIMINPDFLDDVTEDAVS